MNPSDTRLGRRSFLRYGALAGLGLPLAAACGSSSTGASSSTPASSAAGSASASGTPDLGALSFRLSWIENVEFAGSYLADTKGYYTAEGFSSVKFIAGGPTAPPQFTDVVDNRAIVSQSDIDSTAAAIAKGGAVKVIGAQYQKSPFAVMSPVKAPLKTPQDMIGKKIGVQADNEAVWASFLKANNIDASKIDKVPVQFDPTPLTQGSVDGWFSFITNEPVDLKLKGFDTVTFLLSDFNYPLVGNVYITLQKTIEEKRDLLKHFLRAEIKGWKDSIADPAAGAQLAATKYGKSLGLDANEQTQESIAQNALIITGDAKTNGIFTITPALQAACVKTLGIGGTTLTVDQLFDLSLIDEVYQEDPSLI